MKDATGFRLGVRCGRWLMFAGAVVLGGIGAWLLWGDGSSVRLANGNELSLVAVTVGTNRFTTERPWHGWARRVFPKPYQGWIPQTVQSRWTANSNSITVFLELKERTTGTNLSQFWWRLETVNKHGEVQPHEAGSGERVGGKYHGYTFLNYPRRERSFLLRLYDTNQELAATLRVPNPVRRPFPEWRPDPIPVTKTNGDLAVTLKGLTKFLEEFPPGRTNIYLQPELEFAWKGAPTTEWRQAPSFLEDATGNWIGGLFPGLSEHEPAWRWRCWFLRHEDAAFSATERFTLTNLAVLPQGTFTNLGTVFKLGDATMSLVAWSGAGVVIFSNRMIVSAEAPQGTESYRQLSGGYANNVWVEKLQLGHPTLFIAQPAIPFGSEVRCVFRDQNRNRISLSASGPPVPRLFTWVGSQPVSYLHIYQIATNVPSVSLEVIYQQGRSVDFFVEPPRTIKWIGGKPRSTPARVKR